jgi:hypothetical protein
MFLAFRIFFFEAKKMRQRKWATRYFDPQEASGSNLQPLRRCFGHIEH